MRKLKVLMFGQSQQQTKSSFMKEGLSRTAEVIRTWNVGMLDLHYAASRFCRETVLVLVLHLAPVNAALAEQATSPKPGYQGATRALAQLLADTWQLSQRHEPPSVDVGLTLDSI